MKTSLFKGKSTRTKIFTVITIAGIILLLGLNLVATALGITGTAYIDTTIEGFYSLSSNMIKTTDELLGGLKSEKGIEFIFCADPDMLINSDDLRATYFMALNLQKRYKGVSVKTVNVEQNPTAVSRFKTTSRSEIAYTDVIITYGAKYRILAGKGLWTQDTASGFFAYNGEYRIASVLASLLAINKPKAYFLTDHGETYYDPENPESEMSLATSALADLLTERGLEIELIKISEVERIPEDCALLIINNPREDFLVDSDRFNELGYVSDTEKLDRYLVSHQGAIIVNKGYDVTLPNLEGFLGEWGFEFSNSLVKDQENCLLDVGEEGTTILGVYQKLETDFGYGYYESYANLSSAPKMVFTNSGYIQCSFNDGNSYSEPGYNNASTTYTDFIGTSDKAVAYEGAGSTVLTATEGYKALAAASVRVALDAVTMESTYSYLYCTASADFFSNELLANNSYANYDIMASVITNITRTDRFADMSLGGLSGNSISQGGKASIPSVLAEYSFDVYSAYGALQDENYIKTNLGFSEGARITYTVIIMVVPLAVFVLGVIVFIRRKFL